MQDLVNGDVNVGVGSLTDNDPYRPVAGICRKTSLLGLIARSPPFDRFLNDRG
jgi:hypothetical protein